MFDEVLFGVNQGDISLKLLNLKERFLGGIVHRLYFNKITTFRKLDLVPSSGKKGLRLAQPGGPAARVSVLPLFI
jgi:hypothetical protein